MREKDELENPFFEFVNKFRIPVGGFIDVVLLIYSLVQIWRGDAQTITWIVAIILLTLWLTFLIWISFNKSTNSRKSHRRNDHHTEKRQNYHQIWQWSARIGLIITIAALIAGWFYKQYQQQLVVQQNQNKSYCSHCTISWAGRNVWVTQSDS